jgi:hypothetical protein
VTGHPARRRAAPRVLHVVGAPPADLADVAVHGLPWEAPGALTLCRLRPWGPGAPRPAPTVALVDARDPWRAGLEVLDEVLTRRLHDVVHAHDPDAALAVLVAHQRAGLPLRRAVLTVGRPVHTYAWRARAALRAVVAAYPAVVVCAGPVADTLPAGLRLLAGDRLTPVPYGVAPRAAPQPRDPGVAVVSAPEARHTPLAALAAMASGTPVVLGDVPMHRAVAAYDPGAVTLVPAGDGPATAGALARLRGLSPEQRRALGERCRDVVARMYDLASAQAALGRVYAGLTPAGGLPGVALPHG